MKVQKINQSPITQEDISEYKNGVYLLKVTSEQTGKSSTYKLMKL